MDQRATFGSCQIFKLQLNSSPGKKKFLEKSSKCEFAALVKVNGPTSYLWQLPNIQTPIKFLARKKNFFEKFFKVQNVSLPHLLKVMGQHATFGSCQIFKLQ